MRPRSPWTSGRRSHPRGPGQAKPLKVRLLFIFLDGVGIGRPDPAVNPFFAADLPCLVDHLGSIPSLAALDVRGPAGSAFPMDATLGVDGLPQSGTGQYSLLTGRNGAAEIGRHFGPWTPTALRASLAEANLFRTLASAGGRVTFANAYPRGYERSRWFKRPAPVPFAAARSGVLDRHLTHLVRGDAVASDIVNDRVRSIAETDLPSVTPHEAGTVLAGIADRYDFTLFAHYATDTAGHEGDIRRSRRALELVDRFLGGVLAERGDDVGVLVASDHGNIESLTPGHTRNPALGLWFPPVGHPLPREMPTSLLEVAPWVLGLTLDRPTAARAPTSRPDLPPPPRTGDLGSA